MQRLSPLSTGLDTNLGYQLVRGKNSVSGVNLRAAMTQRPERQFTDGLACVKALLSGFHEHQPSCELSLGALSYSRRTLPGTSFPIRTVFPTTSRQSGSIHSVRNLGASFDHDS